MTQRELCKVLIVDDETLIRQGIKHYMNWEREGFRIVGEAANGQQALELIAETRPHILMTDIVMPIMDGEELTKQVNSLYPDIQIVILSSFGDFDYVRAAFHNGAVDYILKPKLETEELLQVLKKAAGRIPSLAGKGDASQPSLSVENAVDRLVSGFEVDAESVEPFRHPSYRFLGLDLRHRQLGETILAPRETRAWAAAAVDAALGHLVLHRFQPNPYTVVYVLGGEERSVQDAVASAPRVTDPEPTVGFVFGEPFEDFLQLGAIYRKRFVKQLQYRFYLPNMPLLAPELLPERKPASESFQLDWFTNELKREHFETAFDYLEHHASALATDYTMEVSEFKTFFGNIIFNIIVLLGNMEYDVKKLSQMKSAYISSIDKAGTAAEVVGTLELFLRVTKRYIHETQSQQRLGSSKIKQLMDYISEHYAEPLSLGEMAKRFHFSPSYLSSYFASRTNEGFAEYVNKVRVEEACKLLSKDAAAISEISGMVGYSDHSYFCKVFKKHMGLSPSQYRRQFREGDL
ncbi:response regulator transcription factor [Paenibacillus sp.]|uniref:response regulator transcription factor n=1 Tax=Paenibacillus sp. TaxID=58172 RepID=UPI002811DED1|nr:response regulator transcription factor [Paenibacillus sp.]